MVRVREVRGFFVGKIGDQGFEVCVGPRDVVGELKGSAVSLGGGL